MKIKTTFLIGLVILFLTVGTVLAAVQIFKPKNEVATIKLGTENQEGKPSGSFSESKTEEALAPTATPTSLPSPTTVPTSPPQNQSSNSISLSGSQTSSGIQLNWQVSGIDVSKGFKVVKNLSGNPVYPGDEFIYLNDASSRAYTWEINDGKTWHFRVCQYLGSTCGAYSNDIAIQAPSGGTSSSVTSIGLAVSKEGASAKLSWNVNGNSPSGFKVVWSKNANPEYPPREGDEWHYLSESAARNDTVNDLSGGTWHFRVCEYLGGRCGVYSNEVSVGF